MAFAMDCSMQIFKLLFGNCACSRNSLKGANIYSILYSKRETTIRESETEWTNQLRSILCVCYRSLLKLENKLTAVNSSSFDSNNNPDAATNYIHYTSEEEEADEDTEADIEAKILQDKCMDKVFKAIFEATNEISSRGDERYEDVENLMKIRNLEERLGNKLVENESLKKELALMSTQIEELQSEGQLLEVESQEAMDAMQEEIEELTDQLKISSEQKVVLADQLDAWHLSMSLIVNQKPDTKQAKEEQAFKRNGEQYSSFPRRARTMSHSQQSPMSAMSPMMRSMSMSSNQPPLGMSPRSRSNSYRSSKSSLVDVHDLSDADSADQMSGTESQSQNYPAPAAPLPTRKNYPASKLQEREPSESENAPASPSLSYGETSPSELRKLAPFDETDTESVHSLDSIYT